LQAKRRHSISGDEVTSDAAAEEVAAAIARAIEASAERYVPIEPNQESSH
jgi:hypothetical protein